MAATSLWPVIVGGLLTLAGTAAASVVTLIRDKAQEQRDAHKRRADKFEELVAAVHEFDHWLRGGGMTVSPIAKVQSISAVYFPQFSELISELDLAAYALWAEMYAPNRATQVRHDGMDANAFEPYRRKLQALLDALKKFAREEFQ